MVFIKRDTFAIIYDLLLMLLDVTARSLASSRRLFATYASQARNRSPIDVAKRRTRWVREAYRCLRELACNSRNHEQYRSISRAT